MNVPKARRLPSGAYCIQLRLGGESHTVTKNTPTECEIEAYRIKAEYLSGRTKTTRPRKEVTLRSACEKYIAKKEKAGRSPSTIRSYESIKENRFQSVMDKPLASVKDWQKVYDEDLAGLKPKTAKNVWTFFCAAAKDAGVELPDIEQTVIVPNEHAFLEPEQIHTFVAAAKNDDFAIPLLLALHGLRFSEILGLTWDKIDLKKDMIHVSGAVVTNKNNERVAKPTNKTAESQRYVPIMIPELKAALKAVKDKKGYITQVHGATLYKHSKVICEAAGLPTVGIHGLRHSFASLCYSLGVPEKVTQQIGGWSDYRTVMTIYTHLSKRDVDKYTDDIKQFFETKNANKKTLTPKK